jgi:predicted transcriptional regulator
MSTSLIDDYILTEGTIRKLYDSRLRLAILDALEEGPMRLADLRRAVNSNAPNTSSKAKDLEDLDMVAKTDEGYALTPHGLVALEKTRELIDYYATHKKFAEFWSERNIDALPLEFLARLGELKMSKIIGGKSDVTEAMAFFLKNLYSIENKFYGISPAFNAEWVLVVMALANKGCDIRLIFSEEVAKLAAKSLGKNNAQLVDTLPNIKFYSLKSVDAGFVVSEKFLIMSLKRQSGVFTVDKAIYSKNENSVSWGMDLFDHYLQKATPVKMTDF